LPAVTTPSGRNAGFSDASFSAEVSRRERLVDGEDGRRGDRGAARLKETGARVFWLDLAGQFDRDDLPPEFAAIGRGERATVRLERVRVERLARQVPLLREQLGRRPLHHDLEPVR